MSELRKTRGVGNGTLERRGNKWCGRWMFKGKRYYRALGEFIGAHAREHAQAALDEAMRPYSARSDREVELHAVARLQGTEDVLREIEDGKPAMTIDVAFEEYAKSPIRPRRAMKNGGENMISEYRGRYTKLVEWVHRNFPDVVELRGVTREIAFAFLSNLEGKVSANTYNKHLTLFDSMWNVLRDGARLTVNPWKEAKHLPQGKSVRRELTLEELKKVSDSTSGEMWLLFAIGIYTGLRLGDAVRIRWEDIDLSRNHIMIEASKTERFTLGNKIAVPLAPQFREILGNAAKSLPKLSGAVVPTLLALYQRDKSALSKRIQAVFEACGIETNSSKENGKRARVVVGFHSLRHTFVSVASDAGIPFSIVQAIVGHSSPAMTRNYLHVSEASLQLHAAQFPSVFRPVAASGTKMIGCDDTKPAVSDEDFKRIIETVGRLDFGRRLDVVRACLSGMNEDSRRKVEMISSGKA